MLLETKKINFWKIFKFIGLIGLFLLAAQSSSVKAYTTQDIVIIFKDNDGNPIKTALDLRLSLWDTYDIKDGEIDGQGNINTNSLHYGYYQTLWTITPDENGYFTENDTRYGFYKFQLNDLPNFPEIGCYNAYLQLEYKYTNEPNASYRLYDFLDDPPYQNVTRILIDSNAAYYVLDAGPRTNWNTFTLDANNNAPTAIKLQFGETLNKFLQWNKTNVRFELNDNLYINGSLAINGHLDFNLSEMVNARLENLASDPVCDENSKGRVYYNTTENIPYYCNGTIWIKF
jgi:hypothetical protein